jgi:signal transduction histidine kinase
LSPSSSPPHGSGATSLADFILTNREPILAEWEAFARTCAPSSGTMDIRALRDHANEMLTVIAADLKTPQGRLAQSEKSKGHAQVTEPERPTAAGEHGAGRARSGFSVEQMVAEYRALRASVIRLWTSTRGELAPRDVEDLTRFNEAIDQALAESVSRFDQGVEQAKETFLAILGHDLRTPLGAIHMSATFMIDTGELEEPHRTLIARIAASAKRTVGMVGDLLDFTRSRLGGGIPIARAPMSLGKVVHEVADEISAAHPGRPIRVDARDDQRGEWDCARITQALGNLIGNAVIHGSDGTAVAVGVHGDDNWATVTVHNRGPVIAPEQLDGIFNPMKARGASAKPGAHGPTGSLGLGLYIAERIVAAHDGRIEVESSEACGTTFTVYLPHRGNAGER